MGCGCGKKKSYRITSNHRLERTNSKCTKCGSVMVYKQQYSPKMKKYVRLWECSNQRCKHRITR